MNSKKEDFLRSELIPLCENLKGDERGRWGKMNAHQMVEHLFNFFKISSGARSLPLTTPPEHLGRYRAFLMSEKEFQQNIKAPVLPEEPLPLQFPQIQQSLDELQQAVNDFFAFFRDNSSKTTLNPVFGELNYEEWIQLHYKHAVHHLKQFGLL